MRRALISLAPLISGLAAAFLGASSAAGAQETGTLLTKRPATVAGTGKAATRRTMQQFGTCAVARTPGKVELALNTPVGDAARYSRLLKDIADPDCLGGSAELYIPRPVMRGALFEAVYEKYFGGSGPTDFKAIPAIDYRGGYTGELSPEAANTVALAQFGDCVARADGGNARRLLIANPETASEAAAISALSPRFAACIPQGRTISFSRSVARAAIAEGLYRLSRAAVGNSQ